MAVLLVNSEVIIENTEWVIEQLTERRNLFLETQRAARLIAPELVGAAGEAANQLLEDTNLEIASLTERIQHIQERCAAYREAIAEVRRQPHWYNRARGNGMCGILSCIGAWLACVYSAPIASIASAGGMGCALGAGAGYCAHRGHREEEDFLRVEEALLEAIAPELERDEGELAEEIARPPSAAPALEGV